MKSIHFTLFFCSSLRSSLHNPLSNACADAWFNDNNIAHLRCRSIFRRCVQMCVDICGCVIAAVSKPLLYILHWHTIFQQQRSAGMPLRYNYNKPEKPRISRVFGYLARFFHPFPNRKIEPRSSYIVGGVIVTTKTKYRLGGQSAHPRNQDISSEKKKCPFFVPKIRCRQEEYDD